jgi:hypothetical protein
MASVKTLNANAEVMNRAAALFMNINAAKGLMEVMRSNYGPKGTIKMLVSGAGDIKLTKDGNVLLREVGDPKGHKRPSGLWRKTGDSRQGPQTGPERGAPRRRGPSADGLLRRPTFPPPPYRCRSRTQLQ